MDENWCALCLAIIKSFTPEQSFEVLNRKPGIKQKHNKSITKLDVEQMIRYRKTKTYKEIGEMFGLKDTAVYKRIKDYKAKRVVA